MSNTRQNQLDVIRFAVLMGREFPAAADLAGSISDLMRMSRRYAGLMERDCNTGDVPEKTVDRLAAKIRAACEAIGAGCVPVFSGDSRGATVKLAVPSGKTDDWGGTGVCVPGS